MGEFNAASAFQTDQTGRVAAAVEEYFVRHSWPADRSEPNASAAADALINQNDDEVLIYPATNGWTVVVWPNFFSDQPAAEFISHTLDTIASTVHVYDGDYWAHHLISHGQVIDRFASQPHYFNDDDPAKAGELTTRWAGNPAAVAELTHRPVAHIAPYLQHLTFTDEGDDLYLINGQPPGKAFSDDTFKRDEPQVFTDFWQRLGITHPTGDTAAYAHIQLARGWFDHLPHGDGEL
jgi:hypothetical protein